MPRTRKPSTRPRLTPAQWRVISSVPRIQILAALQGLGSASAAGLAELTGRSPQSLHYHLGALARAGLVGTRRQTLNGRPVRVFVFDPELNRRTVDPRTGAGVRQLAKLASAMMRASAVRVRRWGEVHDGRPIRVGPDADAILVTELAWFGDRELTEANRHLRAIIGLARRSHSRRKGDRYFISLFQFRDYTTHEARGAAESCADPGRPGRNTGA